MRQVIRLLALLLAPGALLAQPAALPRPFVVQGQLGSPYLGTVYLLPPGAAAPTDSAQLVRGHFELHGTAEPGQLAQLYVLPPGRRLGRHATYPLALYLEPGTVHVVSSDSVRHARMSGTPLNDDLYQLVLATRPATDRQEEILREYQAAPAAQHQDKAYEASLTERLQAAENTRRFAVRQFMQAHPGSPVSLDALQRYGGPTPDPTELDPLFQRLTPALRASEAGRHYAARLDKARQLAPGALAPDFALPDPSGRLLKLSDYRGKYVLLSFWASWYRPCREENQLLLASYSKLKDKNFTILGISLDQPGGRAAWLQAIQADGLPWPQVSDLKGFQSEAAQLYDIQALPQNVLIGPDGRIVARSLRAEELPKQPLSP